MTHTTADSRNPDCACSAALRFGIDGNHYRKGGPRDGEFFYRVELTDGREALIIAANVTVTDGAIVATDPGGTVTLTLAPGTWVSSYMCEALMACDPWAIAYLPELGEY